MRRRPLLRAAAIGGGAYYAGKQRQQSMEREYDEQARISQLEAQQAAQPPPPAAPQEPQVDVVTQLERIGKLHEQGVLTDEEFAAQKAKLLG